MEVGGLRKLFGLENVSGACSRICSEICVRVITFQGILPGMLRRMQFLFKGMLGEDMFRVSFRLCMGYASGHASRKSTVPFCLHFQPLMFGKSHIESELPCWL